MFCKTCITDYLDYKINNCEFTSRETLEFDKKFDELLNKGIVENPSITNIDKFIESAKTFFVDIDKAKHIGSMFTIRTVLPNRDKDDARPTLVENPTDKIFNVFSGKIGTCVSSAEKLMECI